ncbi:hypothetical protein ASPZODRAFT_1230696 [Penicilliopsis zonata CBS 506.65]|uniref:Ubiquinol-cytochrome-c reductase cytochrome c1 n=1 Tax=Penicilliopsis zonata CBS 506.65 TaxID=1073090 RepID=A0A1L9S7M2_9EURO|nr:hypothetical protein ASPZODRAFT_1230696 [Penicilliopsis zonata CBS 506.65]OJJ43168.1 hypothetical protein ASPZODRAFT_1230696 [Penicilliopsis zonata CBS 506.65]
MFTRPAAARRQSQPQVVFVCLLLGFWPRQALFAMVPSVQDRRRVYFATRHIFSGGRASLRKPKKILQVLETHRCSLQPLLRGYTFENILAILHSLLADDVFSSVAKAKIRFPELFMATPSPQSPKEATVLRGSAASPIIVEGEEESQQEARPIAPRPLQVPENIPVDRHIQTLAYGAQHAILTVAQTLLEEACFAFAKKWMPNFLENHKWDCAAAIELSYWTNNILGHWVHVLPRTAFNSTGQTNLAAVFRATNELRHTAVHRVRVPAYHIGNLLQDAIKMLDALKDDSRKALLEDLHAELESKSEAMACQRMLVEESTQEELAEIRQQRAEMDRREQEILEKSDQQDVENRQRVGRLLERSVKKMFTPWPRFGLQMDSCEDHNLSDFKLFMEEESEDEGGLGGLGKATEDSTGDETVVGMDVPE